MNDFSVVRAALERGEGIELSEFETSSTSAAAIRKRWAPSLASLRALEEQMESLAGSLDEWKADFEALVAALEVFKSEPVFTDDGRTVMLSRELWERGVAAFRSDPEYVDPGPDPQHVDRAWLERVQRARSVEPKEPPAHFPNGYTDDPLADIQYVEPDPKDPETCPTCGNSGQPLPIGYHEDREEYEMCRDPWHHPAPREDS